MVYIDFQQRLALSTGTVPIPRECSIEEKEQKYAWARLVAKVYGVEPVFALLKLPHEAEDLPERLEYIITSMIFILIPRPLLCI